MRKISTGTRFLATLLLVSGWSYVRGRQFAAPAPAPLATPAVGAIVATPGTAGDKPLCTLRCL